jgi:hypothetical protein
VLGERFAVEALGELLGDPVTVRDWLETLADREVLERPDGERTSGAPEFLFRHALLRESAYAQLDPADCARHHAAAAAWLERRPAPDPIAVAEHWERAGDAPRSVSWLATAAEAAWDAFDLETGRRVIARGYALGATGVDRGRLRLVERWSTESAVRAFECASEAASSLPEGSDRWVQAVGQAFFAGVEIGRPEARDHLASLLRYVEQPIARTPRVAYALYAAASGTILVGQTQVTDRLVHAFDDPGTGADADPFFEIFRIHAALLGKRFSRFTLEGVASNIRILPALAEAARTPRGRYQAYYALGYTFDMLGDWRGALSAYREALRYDTMFPGFTTCFIAHALAQLGDVAGALSVLSGHPPARGVQALYLEFFRGWVLYIGGRLKEAEAVATALTSALAPFPVLVALGDNVKTAAALDRNAPAQALEHAEHGLPLPGITPDIWFGLSLHRVRALSQLGRDAEARVVLREARDRLFALRDTIEDPTYRARYVDAFPEARELVRLADEWFG